MSQISTLSVFSHPSRLPGKTTLRLLPFLISMALTAPAWAGTVTVTGTPGVDGVNAIPPSFTGTDGTSGSSGSSGGAATADINISGILTDNTYTVNATGGSGGSSGIGNPFFYPFPHAGNGGDASSSLTLADANASALNVYMNASGGAGGGTGLPGPYPVGIGTPGNGGTGTVYGNVSSVGTLSLGGAANGGNGGREIISDLIAAGGAASSSLTGSSSGGEVDVVSRAYGGNGPDYRCCAPTTGSANATALSTTVGSNTGTSLASSLGTSGTAYAQSTASNGVGGTAIAWASAPATLGDGGGGAPTANTTANFAGNWSGNASGSSNGISAYSHVVALPLPATVAQILGNTHPNTTGALSNATILGAGSLGASYIGNYYGGPQQTYTAGAEYRYNLSGSHAFTLGLLNLATYSGGFDSLSFSVKNGSTTLLSDTFTTLAAAQHFFTDNPYSLGTLSGNVDLALNYSLTASAAKGAGVDYLIAMASPVPEPGEWLLLLVGMGAMAVKTRPRLAV